MTHSGAVSVLGRIDVSRETVEKLRQHYEMVLRWTPTINLISKASQSDGWSRHVEDSAQLFTIASGPDLHWVDLGSGGGFPGVVIAVLAMEKAPGTRVTLVEADQRKAAFLREVVRVIGLNTIVLSERIEALPGQNADVISARALGPLSSLIGLAKGHLNPGGRCLFPKGRQAETEVEVARTWWNFDVVKHKSVSSHDGSVLEVSRIERF